jgi:hypothetical protein
MLSGEAFLTRIITGDKTWAHHYQLETKDSQWNGIIHNHKQTNKQTNKPQQKKKSSS